MPIRIIPFQQGMKFGFGYDLLAGSPLTTPAVQGTVSAIPQAQGQDVISSFLTITDLDTLHQELGVNVDAGGSYFGVSADVKVNYAKECNVSHFATHVMVRVGVQDAFENFDAPVLTDDATSLLTNIGDVQSARFRERFGDLFIDGLQKGGEYFATWEIVSVDQTVRESIATKVEAAFSNPVAAAHLDVDVESAKASSSSHTEVHVHVLQKGAIDHTDQTMAEVLAKAHDFPPSVAGDKAAAFAVSIADYKTLKLPNDAFNFLQIQNQRDVLAEHARKRFEFLTLRNSISYIRLHPEDFEGVNDALLASQLQKVTDAINKMETEANACLRDANACTFTPFDVSDFPLPQPKPGALPPLLPGQVRVPSFIGTPIVDVADAVVALEMAALSQIGGIGGGVFGGGGGPAPFTIDEIINLPTTMPPDQAGPPLKLRRDLIEFLHRRAPQLDPPIEAVITDPAKPAFGKVNPTFRDLVVGDQIPTAGSAATEDTVLALRFR